jgi:predicted XRE-type DNA-binding protein
MSTYTEENSSKLATVYTADYFNRLKVMMELRTIMKTKKFSVEKASIAFNVSCDKIKKLLKGDANDFTIVELKKMAEQYNSNC